MTIWEGNGVLHRELDQRQENNNENVVGCKCFKQGRIFSVENN